MYLLKKPWLAILLSFIYPGLGHLYLGYVKKGIVLLVVEFISILLISVVVGIFLYPIIWIYSIVNAYQLSTKSQVAS
ncbi:sugar ABC transporter permease [Paenibacillus sp. FSL H8-0537]|uniref:sugar ABC transporter permease n=1 Tax=Paenibacillus sp. FSL H8-0537 TaxID=2921399 RepID=UPI0031011CEA